MNRTILAVLSALIVPALPPQAAAEEFSAAAEAALVSAYVWRGIVVNDEAVLEPSIEVEKAGVYVNVWGNLNLTDNVTDAGDFNEVDLTLGYAPELNVDKVDLDLGLIRYIFPNTTVETDQGDTAAYSTTEVYLGASYDWVVAPSLTLYYDFDEANGFYLLGTLSYTLPLEGVNEKLGGSVDFTTAYASSDYNALYFGVDESKVSDAGLHGTLDYAVNDGLTLSALLSYTWFWDSDIEDAAGVNYLDKDKVYGGFALSYTY